MKYTNNINNIYQQLNFSLKCVSKRFAFFVQLNRNVNFVILTKLKLNFIQLKYLDGIQLFNFIELQVINVCDLMSM